MSYNTVEISRLVSRSYDQRVERRFYENRHRNYCIILYYKRVLYYIVLQTTTMTICIYINTNFITLHWTIASDGRRSRCAEDILGESVFYTKPENRCPDVHIREHNVRRYQFFFHFFHLSCGKTVGFFFRFLFTDNSRFLARSSSSWPSHQGSDDCQSPVEDR